ERISGVKSEETAGEGRGRGRVEDYLVTLKMPGFKESDIEVQVFDDDLIVQAYKDGEVFKRSYDLPTGFEPTGIKYKYEDEFLIIRVSLKRKEEM
ncbi:MAG: Hsp20/alpha crystallin family protein, partial [Candidatus Bathyarchaeia archaeon]